MLILASTCGLALGSYAVTTGLRAGQGISSAFGRSRCDGCGVTLSFARTVPVVSYLRTGGACHACGTRIDPLHLAGEVGGALVCGLATALTPMPQALLVATCGLLLIASAACDWTTRRLPDVTTLLIAAMALGLAVLDGPATVAAGLVATVLTATALLGVRAVSMRGGRPQGLGLGDVKLAAALALWLGGLTPWMIAIAALIGLGVTAVSRPRDGRLPFGPMLAIAGWTLGLAATATGHAPWP